MDVSDENMRAIYVNTNLDTNFLCLVSPNSNFVQLKDQILRDHEVFYGNITLNWVKVTRNQKNYHVPAENMRLRTAFHKRKPWSVLANVCRTPPNPVDMKKKKKKKKNLKMKKKQKKKQQQQQKKNNYSIAPLKMETTILEQPDFLPTNAADNATKQKDEKSASEGLYNHLNDVPSQDVSSNLADLVKDTDLPMSAVPEFKDEYLIIPTSSNQVMNSQVPLGATKLGQNNPARKTGVLSPRNKSSTTSDNEVETSGSTCNVGTVDDSSSSSDSSERGSKGGKMTYQHGNLFSPSLSVGHLLSSASSASAHGVKESKGGPSGRDENKMDFSVFKGMDIASVLRCSSQYKKSIKQAALQSQMEDDENGPVESVPDSYSD